MKNLRGSKTHQARRSIIASSPAFGWMLGAALTVGANDPSTSLPAEAPADWWNAVQKDLAASEYHVTWQDRAALAAPGAPGAAYQAPNRAHNLRTYFTDDGIHVVPRDVPKGEAPPWEWGLTLTGFGREGEMVESPCAELAAVGNRVEYRRGELVEWYVNDQRGLEQGFTIRQEPSAVSSQPSDNQSRERERPVARLELAVIGSVAAEIGDDGQSVDFLAPDGARVIHFAELHAFDATGRTLPTWFALHDESASADASEPHSPFSILHSQFLSIMVDDREAVYPLTIDPLATSPNWTAEMNQPDTGFGYSVATAGDVNSDGYSDVIVGAYGYDTGETNAGRAFVWLGSPSGLGAPGTPGNFDWTAESNQADAYFGRSVATAGDVNGDGYSDVIVGAPHYDTGETNAGRAFVWLGSAAFHLEPDGTPTNADWTAESDQADALFGGSVATAGDVNGDGYSDVIVGTYFEPFTNNAGQAWVWLGSPSGLGANGTPTNVDWTAEGPSRFGRSVATAGDVNGDGYSDVIVGADGYANPQPGEGRAFVWLGSAAFHLEPDGTPTNADWTAESDQDGAAFGVSVATAGDVNGDGYSDVIVGAEGYYIDVDIQFREGWAFVWYGSSDGLGAESGTPANADWTAESNDPGASFGWSVASAGDVNGDGYSDVIVGATTYTNDQQFEGGAFVYLGSSSGLGPNGTPGNADWTAEGDQFQAYFGYSVATAVDVNGDGYSDVIVGARYYTGPGHHQGRAFVYHGRASGLSPAADWPAESNQTNAEYGYSVAGAGDVNGDGFFDVIVGAPFFDGGPFETDEGRAFVYHGSAAALSLEWTAESDQPNARFGWSVASAGDVNGDGYGDVIVGSPFFDSGQTDEGRAFVWYGSSMGLGDDGTPGNADWTTSNNRDGAQYGYSVATAGDVNGDGYHDVIVGSPLYDSPTGPPDHDHEGRAYGFLGSASGLAAVSAWSVKGNTDFSSFGGSVAAAGDVNGDGFSDVIVGAPNYNNGQTQEGGAFVYHGAPTAAGLSFAANWTAESDQSFAAFGISVATAGDVDGDGYSDVIVGASGYDNPQLGEGSAFVYHGSAAGLGLPGTPSNADWTVESDQTGAGLGYSVATAGDVYRDGYSDVIVGAPFFRLEEFGPEGKAFVYNGSDAGLGPNGAPSNADSTLERTEAGSRFGWSVATAGDVNGDGVSDVIVGAPRFSNPESREGGAFLYYGNGGPGLLAWIRQQRTDGLTNIGLLGRSDSPSGFRLSAVGRPPMGRGPVGLQWEVKPPGMLMDGTGLQQSAVFIDSGAARATLNELVSGLSADTLYHWRLRMLYATPTSPFQRHGPWLSAQGNGWNEPDVRTACGGGDCNSNGVEDGCDITHGTSLDCDTNGTPDECDPDCNANGVPDTCEPDADADGVTDACDNCPLVANADQADCDGDGIGDACELPDSDGDLVPDGCDNCPMNSNGNQANADGDSLGDACDPCPEHAPTQLAKLLASDAAAQDLFGFSVAIDGDTAIIGGYRNDDVGTDSGSAYVFVRSGSTWTEQQKLTASDAAGGDFFGYSVAISGDTAIVGAPDPRDPGSAYVFVRSGMTWTQQAKLVAAGAAGRDHFGRSVGIDGDTAIVGAPDSGSAYVFVRSGSIWTEQTELTASDAAAGDFFGASVAIDGDTAVVGAYGNDDAGNSSGSAYVFVRSGTSWTEQAKLTASDAAAADTFGQSVAISGHTVVIGGEANDDAGNNSGSAYVFVRSGTVWTEQTKLTASDAAAGDGFGQSVAISGDIALVGASGDDDAGSQSGSAYMFVRSGTTWTEQAKHIASDAAADDTFGVSVAISGDTSLVGAYQNDDAGSASGSAYVFELGVTDTDGDGVPDVCDNCLEVVNPAQEDANQDGIGDACEGAPAAAITGGLVHKNCDLVLAGPAPFSGTEPRQGGITELHITFNVVPGGPGPSPVTIQQATCAAPAYTPYAGASTVSASAAGNTLVLTFTPGLENARKYKMTIGPDVTSIAGQFVEVRGLVADASGDGMVNAADRSAIVGVWTGSGFSCATDINGSGQTNAGDRSAIVGAWTNPAANCAP